MADQVLARILALKTTPLPQLKQLWRDLHGNEPPTYSRPWLEGRLAYRLQELALGGLAQKTVRQLEQMGEQQQRERKNSTGKRTDHRPLTGTKLIREFRGVAHEVIVQLDHYAYNGVPYKSLSAVAKAISGTSWNGYTFFGLRQTVRKS